MNFRSKHSELPHRRREDKGNSTVWILQPGTHTVCQKGGRGPRSQKLQGRWAHTGLITRFLKWRAPNPIRVSFSSTSVIIIQCTQDFPKGKKFTRFISKAGGFRVLSHWTGSRVGLKRTIKAQRCIGIKK